VNEEARAHWGGGGYRPKRDRKKTNEIIGKVIFSNSNGAWKFPRLRPLVVLTKAVDELQRRLARSIGGKIEIDSLQP
jgi:hypothetical protein